MTVYGIHSGSVYEGGGINEPLFKDYEDARKQTREIVGVEQKEDDMVYGDEIGTDQCPIHQWTETKQDYWTNGVDEIVILHLEVK